MGGASGFHGAASAHARARRRSPDAAPRDGRAPRRRGPRFPGRDGRPRRAAAFRASLSRRSGARTRQQASARCAICTRAECAPARARGPGVGSDQRTARRLQGAVTQPPHQGPRPGTPVPSLCSTTRRAPERAQRPAASAPRPNPGACQGERQQSSARPAGRRARRARRRALRVRRAGPPRESNLHRSEARPRGVQLTGQRRARGRGHRLRARRRGRLPCRFNQPS